MAETEGFEPSIPFWGYAHLANECLQPLGHVSVRDESLVPREDAYRALGRPVNRKLAPRARRSQGSQYLTLRAQVERKYQSGDRGDANNRQGGCDARVKGEGFFANSD